MKTTNIFLIGLLSVSIATLFNSAWHAWHTIVLLFLNIAMAFFANVHSVKKSKSGGKDHKTYIALAYTYFLCLLGLFVSLIINHLNPIFFDKLISLFLISTWVFLSSITLNFYMATDTSSIEGSSKDKNYLQ